MSRIRDAENTDKKQHGCVSCCTVCVVAMLLAFYLPATLITAVLGGERNG